MEEMQVVVGIEANAQDLLGREKMTQIRARVIPTNRAITRRIQWIRIVPKSGLLNDQWAFGRKKVAVASMPCGLNAIEKVDAPIDIIDQILWRPNTHGVSRL